MSATEEGSPDLSASWIDDMPPELAAHAAILRRMVDACGADSRMRALQVQGSIGRGTGDALSDIDVGVVVAEVAWPAICAEIPAFVRGLGEVLDHYQHFLPDQGDPGSLKAWAQFPSGIQLDLLVLPASRLLGSGPDGRNLFDRDHLLMPTDHPMRVSEQAEVAKWAFLAWHDLSEVAKYVQRGQTLAAAEWLNSARQATISCWAAAHGVEYAGFANVAAARLGVIAPWPDGIEETYAGPDAGAILAAASALARLQEAADAILETRLGIRRRPLPAWVREQLELLRQELPIPDTRRAVRSPQER